MSETVQEKVLADLCRIVEKHRSLKFWREADQCYGVLLDVFPESEINRERNALDYAAQKGIPIDIEKIQANLGPKNILLGTLIQSFEQNSGMDLARWAVLAWAKALGFDISGLALTTPNKNSSGRHSPPHSSTYTSTQPRPKIHGFMCHQCRKRLKGVGGITDDYLTDLFKEEIPFCNEDCLKKYCRQYVCSYQNCRSALESAKVVGTFFHNEWSFCSEEHRDIFSVLRQCANRNCKHDLLGLKALRDPKIKHSCGEVLRFHSHDCYDEYCDYSFCRYCGDSILSSVDITDIEVVEGKSLRVYFCSLEHKREFVQ